ncbi:MAG: Asp23/Gls24 family envelope stress response protein [Candidatus Omnitrophica bacterium]|nr:Asp23/Gls24 family envelope stress response protein [Candidatus Omnitrophota bacterium]MBU4487771.1 Asp23/Gls24 family envelope stress response protein [Candidatus Omnitrophota bacterium]MCG2705181.1 Asp23/Gls24 family envelope stress response protein [Candidatus Omnitrophota bacterium]
MNTGYPGYDNIQLGDIRLDNEVIKNIAIKAATEVQGVHELQKGRIRDMWSTLTGKTSAMGARLDFRGNTELSIKLNLTVEYGVNITDAASAVQENVKKAVEYMTGLNVINVTVNIIGMHLRK